MKMKAATPRSVAPARKVPAALGRANRAPIRRRCDALQNPARQAAHIKTSKPNG